MTARDSLTGRYDRVVRELAHRQYRGDEKAARRIADDAIIAIAMGKSGMATARDMPEIGPAARQSIEGLLDGVRDIPEAVNALLSESCAIIRETTARDSGAVYTPAPVARYMCNKAIESYLTGNIEKGTSLKVLLDDRDRAALSRVKKLLDCVRVVDTSCGTGIFLEMALEEICRLKMAIAGQLGQDRVLHSDVVRSAIAKNIYGFDIEPYSIKVTGVRLLLRLAASGYTGQAGVGAPTMNLSQANVLMSDNSSLPPGEFDVVVGNPPYMRVKSMFGDALPDDRKPLKERFAGIVKSSGLYQCQEGNLNLYKLFIERNLSLLRENGSMCLIFPSSFLNETTSTRLRQRLFASCEVEEIVEIPERSKLFDGVNQATCIVSCRKGIPTKCLTIKHGADIGNLDGNDTILADIDELSVMTAGRMEVPLLASPDLEWAMLGAMRRIPPFGGNDRFPTIGEISVGNVDETIHREFISDAPTGNIFVKGVHLKEYSVDLQPDGPRPRWVRKADFLAKHPAAARTIAMPRVIGRNTRNKASTRRLKFALLPEGCLCGNSIKQIVVTDENIDPLYLTALLNSSVLNWYFEVFCSQNNIRNYSIEALPIPRATAQVQEAFAFVARMIMRADGEARAFLDKRLMDAMAYELYFMDMRMLSSAVLASIEDGVTAETLKRQDDIGAIIDRIAAREGFKVTQRATYRL